MTHNKPRRVCPLCDVLMILNPSKTAFTCPNCGEVIVIDRKDHIDRDVERQVRK